MRTGPFQKYTDTSVDGPSGKYIVSRRYQQWYRQPKVGGIYPKPLPYDMYYGVVGSHGPWFETANMGYNHAVQLLNADWGAKYGQQMSVIHNKAYQKWLSKIRSSAQMLNNLAEIGQTIGLIQKSLRALRHPFDTFFKAMGKGHGGRVKHTARWNHIPEAYTAFHFGIAPLMRDIFDALERLQALAKPKPEPISVTKSYTVTSVKSYPYGPQEDVIRLRQSVRMSGWVSVLDEKTALLSDLGVTNPAAPLWEVTPVSWLVDWFVPVGQYLNLFSDLRGYKVSDPYTTWYADVKRKTTYRYPSVVKTLGNQVIFAEGTKVSRTIGTNTMKPVFFSLPPELSARRAAVLVSVLYLRLTSKMHGRINNPISGM